MAHVNQAEVDRIVDFIRKEIPQERWNQAVDGYPGEIETALIDAVLSIMAAYGNSPETGVRKRVANYRALRNQMDETSKLDDLQVLAAFDGTELADQIDIRQRVSGRLKTEAIVDAAASLVEAGVVHAQDLDPKSREHKNAYVRVHGLGAVTWRYLTMLLGTPDFKPDTWICRFVEEALGVDHVDPERTGELLNAAADELDVEAHYLDHAIWSIWRERKKPEAVEAGEGFRDPDPDVELP